MWLDKRVLLLDFEVLMQCFFAPAVAVSKDDAPAAD